ncbi:MAG TPA: hypothetical protein VNT31_01185 [Nocardioides sp.]|jgi:antibiotic biosynthesis monooxygenase (ABM) superfamily enzyme|nr:hypothetical protein [Nocardioides sp.]
MPATMAMVRRTTPDRADELEDWARRLAAAAAKFPGYAGSVVAPLARDAAAAYVVVALRFTTAGELAVWEASGVRSRLVEQGVGVTEGTPEALPLDVLSSLPGLHGDAPSPPRREPRLRAVAMIWTALFPPAVVLNLVLAGGGNPLSVVARTMGTTLVLVPVVVLLTLPLVGKAVRKVEGRFRRAAD